MENQRIKELYYLDDPGEADLREALDALIEERAMRKKVQVWLDWIVGGKQGARENRDDRCASLYLRPDLL